MEQAKNHSEASLTNCKNMNCSVRREKNTCGIEYVGLSESSTTKGENQVVEPFKSNRFDSTNMVVVDEIKPKSRNEDDDNVEKQEQSDEECLKCNICGEKFGDCVELENHLKIHAEKIEEQHKTKEQIAVSSEPNDTVLSKKNENSICKKSSKLHICNICEKEFSRKKLLKSHKFIHVGDKIYKCAFCTREFATILGLHIHQNIHTKKKLYSCTICEYETSQAVALKKHLFTKHKVINRLKQPKKKLKCSYCPLKFKLARQVKAHEREHTGEGLLPCEHCGRKFRYISDLERHKRIHSGDRPHVCSICAKAFVEAYNLKQHYRTHTGYRPYICPICQKAFANSSNLHVHKRIHTGETPYTCKLCHEQFKRTDNLKVHIHTVHLRTKPYTCNICRKGFTNTGNLNVHRRIHTRAKQYS